MRVLRVVSIGSRSGVYGGPFDTAKRQVALAQASGRAVQLWAGVLANDQPDPSSLPESTTLIRVRMWVPQLGFASAISFRAVASLVREIRKVEAVHVSFSRECLPMTAAALAAVFRKRLIVQPHGMLTSRTSLLHRIVDFFVKPMVGSSAVVVALTEVEREDLRTWMGPKSSVDWLVMGNPVGSLPGVPAEVRSAPLVREALWVARLHPRKRVGDFLAAAKISLGHDRGTRYVIVGPDGGDLSEVRNACSQDGNLIYEGSMSSDEVTKRVNNTGVFVLTSLSEPWGNVLATALSLGLPVVVTESSALAGTIEHFGAGYVVQDSAPDQVEAAIEKLLGSDVLYRSCSAGALKLAQELLAEPVQTSKLADLYAQPIE